MAGELGMNVSQTMDALRTEEAQGCFCRCWNEQNDEAIDTYIAHVVCEGLPRVKYCTFLRGR